MSMRKADKAGKAEFTVLHTGEAFAWYKRFLL